VWTGGFQQPARANSADWKALLADDADLMREIVRAAVTRVPQLIAPLVHV